MIAIAAQFPESLRSDMRNTRAREHVPCDRPSRVDLEAETKPSRLFIINDNYDRTSASSSCRLQAGAHFITTPNEVGHQNRCTMFDRQNVLEQCEHDTLRIASFELLAFHQDRKNHAQS